MYSDHIMHRTDRSNGLVLLWFSMLVVIYVCCGAVFILLIIEPRSKKTGLRGFRPGPIQTGLYSHRREIETGTFGYR